MSVRHKVAKSARAEHRASKPAARQKDRPLVKALGAIAELADQPPLIAISLATCATGLVSRRPALTRAGVRMLLSHALATGAKAMIKNAIDRSRPARALADGKHQAHAARGRTSTAYNSFPSGHTAGAVSVAQAVSHEIPQARVAARTAAAAVGAVQLPNAKHYISDVIVGAALGWASERIVGIALNAGEQRVRRFVEDRATRLALDEAQAHPS